MFSIPHLVIIFIVVLVVFGPHKLPELARGLGKIMAEFRKASTDFKMAFEEEMRTIERQTREAEWKKSQEAAAAATQDVQPATFATLSGAETPHSLSESLTVPEPTISPVSESIAREPQASFSNPPRTGAVDSQIIDARAGSSSEPISDRVTEGTGPASREADSLLDAAPADSGSNNSGNSPAHDRQPA
jgi:sec-independent protein translocase protein TatB